MIKKILFGLVIFCFLISFVLVIKAYFFNSGRFDSSISNRWQKPPDDFRKEPSNSSPKETFLVAGGDVMLTRWVGIKIRQANDFSLPFRNIYQIFERADIAFINLESPFLNEGPPVTEGLIYKAEPEYLEGLLLSGIDVVSLANNHIKNKGWDGLLFTLNHLKEHKIMYSGAGQNFEEAHSPALIERNNLKFAFLSYTYSDGMNFYSTSERSEPDVAFMNEEEMKKDVGQIRPYADVVIVYMHAGTEYVSYPNEQQKSFARAAIDSGADLVIGSHPHWVQTIEKYKDRLIIYALGNLIFDQMFSQETREGVLARCKFLDNKLSEVEFIPYIIEDYNQPRLAQGEEKLPILMRMGLKNEIISL